jgi:hypothetical protein
MDLLFEENPKWVIGPGSRKKIATIVANRQATEAEVREVDLMNKRGAGGVATLVEDVEDGEKNVIEQ